jgi:hypothetical protein
MVFNSSRLTFWNPMHALTVRGKCPIEYMLHGNLSCSWSMLWCLDIRLGSYQPNNRGQPNEREEQYNKESQ